MCDHDYKENPVVETVRFGLDIVSFGLASMAAPRRCRKCGQEEP